MSSPRGLFLSFEGIEGSGKSTQAGLLVDWLRHQGREVLSVREPGGTALSEAVRHLLLRRDGPSVVPWAELCLYEAARAQLTAEVIGPALARNAVVVADRFGDASEAYQGGARGLGAARVRRLNDWVTGGISPVRTFLLDLPPEEGLARVQRARGRFDRLEGEPLVFHRRVRSAYLRMARREPERFQVLDARQPMESIAAQIHLAVERLLAG